MEDNKFFNYIKKISLDIGYQVALLFGYIFILVLLGGTIFFVKDTDPLLKQNLAGICMELVVLVIFILIFRKKIIPDYYDFKKNFKKYIKKYFKYWLLGLIVMIISNIIINSFLTLPSNEVSVRNTLKELPYYYLFAVIISAPIVEECLTRIILKDTFKHKIVFCIISGLIFASLHLLVAKSIYELFYLIPYGALGFAFAKMHADSNNIWVSIFFHALHNTIATLIVLTIMGVII